MNTRTIKKWMIGLIFFLVLWSISGAYLFLNFPIILAILVPIWVYYRRAKYLASKEKFSILHELVVNVFFIYILAVIYYTLSPFSFSPPTIRGRLNLEPFADIITQFRFRNFRHAVLYTGGNLLLLVPFGFFVPLISHKARSFWRVAKYGILFSLSIELTQYLFSDIRTANIDDLILNTIGCMVGFLVFVAIKPLATKSPLITIIIDSDNDYENKSN